MARLVFPAECVSCRREGDWLCARCRAQLTATPAALCRICGQAGANGICPKCAEKTGLDGIISLFHYRNAGWQKLIKTGKYTGQADALRFLVGHYRVKLVRSLPDADWVFSFVPLDSRRLAERGFNQAELIARGTANPEFDIQTIFRKIRPTQPQVSLDQTQRQKNLGKAFALVQAPPTDLVICDDVITTGTTLSKLAKLAKRRGSRRVWALTLAHG